MTYEEKKKALESYGRLKIRCADLEENIARLRSERERITPRLCDTPGGGGFTNRLQALTERLFELEETLGQKRIEAIEAVCKAQDAVNFLEDEDERNILGYYYILGHSPEETAEHYHISESTFYRILRSGIEHARFYSQKGEKSAKVGSE